MTLEEKFKEEEGTLRIILSNSHFIKKKKASVVKLFKLV